MKTYLWDDSSVSFVFSRKISFGSRYIPLLVGMLTMGCLGSIASSTPLDPGLADTLRKADAKLPRPRRLPTITAINWDGFPNDLNGNYGQSGRHILVQPGKPGAIAQALRQASKGDTIILQAGTYEEGLNDDYRALVIQKDGIVLRTLPGQRAKIVPRKGVNRGLEIQANHVMVHGIDLIGFINAGISLGREEHTIRGVILSDINVIFKKDGEWHDGIVAFPDNRSRKQPTVDGLLLRNVVVEGASLGISCNSGPCTSWWLENVKIKNAVGSGSGADTLAVEEGDNIVLVNVEVTNASADGIDLKARHVLILNSYVHNIDRNGIKLWKGGDIINTIIHHTGADAAFVFKDGGHFRILHSIMAYHNYHQGQSYNLTAGYDSQEPLEVELVDSIFYNTSGGMFLSDKTKLQVQNCIFYGMENKKVLRAKVKNQEVEIYLHQPPTIFEKLNLGKNNLFVDPQFVKPERGDFYLRLTSPAINHGKNTGNYPKSDRKGGARIKGGAPDIGPFEMR